MIVWKQVENGTKPVSTLVRGEHYTAPFVLCAQTKQGILFLSDSSESLTNNKNINVIYLSCSVGRSYAQYFLFIKDRKYILLNYSDNNFQLPFVYENVQYNIILSLI